MNRLSRHIAKLILAGMILTVGGCAYDDTVRDLREQKAEVTMLSDHMETMGVWGWQTTSEGVTECLFLNQEVAFSASLAKWTYSPLKYWDTRSKYRFYAYAPHSGSVPGVTVAIDSTHAVSISGVTLTGCNTIDSGVPYPPANFSHVTDIDWMLDRTGQSMAGIYRNEVMFNMQHILSKICVRVRRSDTALPDSLLTISIDSLEIGNFISQGDYVQAIDYSHPEMVTEWTPIDTLPRYTVTSAKYVSVPDSAVYTLESLLIPQPVSTDQYIRVWYNIGNRGGYMNHVDNVFSLSGLFGRFEPGKSYVITVIIGPEPIRFDAGVVEWDNQ